MILEKIVLENFRQFYGKQEIVFSQHEERNVTIIHAENGFGKTTLLNAFLWVLHGKRYLTNDFEKKDHLINEKCVRESNNPENTYAEVELTFLHGKLKIVARKRITLGQQNSKSDSNLEVTIKNELGKIYRPINDREYIRSIIPPGIANFLFFNGENIDKYAMEESADDVSSAIRKMMGLELIQRTIDDLEDKEVRGTFVKELRDNASKEKTELINERENELQNRKKIQEDINNAQSEIKSADEEIRTIDSKLEANQEVASLQKRRAELEAQAEEHGKKIQEYNIEIKKLINEDGYAIIGKSLIDPSNSMMDQWRKDGQIPAQVLDTFLKDLLKAEKCICQRDLKAGSTFRASVESLLQIAGDQNFNTAVGALDRSIGHINGIADKASEKLKQIRISQATSKGSFDRVKEEIAEISKNLGNKDDNTIRELEDRRNSLNSSRDNILIRIGQFRERIPVIESRIRELQSRIESLTDDEETTRIAQKQLNLIDGCIDTFKKILDAETAELIPALTTEINKHLSQAVNQRGYSAQIDNNFSIKVINEQGGVVARNQALRQTLSLCFIGSLIDLSKRRADLPTIVNGLTGTVYPIVMDSPFGAMDLGLQNDIAKIIPELANQVVAMISSSQYFGGVENTLKQTKKIGRRYYLRYHNTSLPDKKYNKTMIIEGKEYQLFQLDKFEHTQIVEII
jgi:DNA sulfur modification protein DndD